MMISAAVEASARRSSAASVCAWVARVSKLKGRITSVAGSSFMTSTKNQQAGGEQAAAQHRHVHPVQGRPLAEAEAARGVVHVRRDLAQAGLDSLQSHREEAREVGIDQRGDAAGEQQPRADSQRLPALGQPAVHAGQRDQHAHRDHRPGTA